MVRLRIWVKNLDKKREIREKVLKFRNSLTLMNKWEQEKKIIKHVLESQEFELFNAIYTYVGMGSEVDTRPIIDKALALGKKVACPKIKNGNIEFYYINSTSELTPGQLGILEPMGEEIAMDADALVIVPGIAFDYGKNRIGYGKGYYDKYLAKYPWYTTMGLAFQVQIVDILPIENFDIALGIIATEEGLL
jgi:5,10-methenyltetrahydrofolate synthetase